LHFTKRTIGLITGPLLFTLILLFFEPQGLSDSARAVLASTLWIATWWVTEAIPIPATSLLPIVLLPLTGGLNVRSATAAYGDKMLFLFMGAFMIAIAMEKWNLHRRIALNVIHFVGTNANRMVLGFMIATSFLSMWISNTATTMMMMPIGVAIISQFRSYFDETSGKYFGKMLMLGIAYSASMGGLGTLVGTPTNPIFAAIVKQTFAVEISFASWLSLGLPLVTVLVGTCWFYLTRIAFPLKKMPSFSGRDAITEELDKLGGIRYEEKVVLGVFMLTAILWISRSYLLTKLLPAIDDTIIVMFTALLLFLIPAGPTRKKRVLDWDTAVKLPWGVILLFGGGLSIAAGFQESGLAKWIGDRMMLLKDFDLLIIIFGVTLLVIFLTEITSNVATATIILPILGSISQAIGIHPFSLMIPATLAASCAFMLPVATAPNAIVFSSDEIKMQDMIKAGLWLNIFSIILISLFIYFILPIIWDIDLFTVPKEF